MGQTSSQVDHLPTIPLANENDMDRSLSNKTRKPRKQKRKNVEAEHTFDPEQESARALLQMRGVDVADSKAPYYADDFAASQQLVTESPPLRSSVPLPIEEAAEEPPRMSQKHTQSNFLAKKKEAKRKKRGKTDGSPIFSIARGEEESRYPQLPSTLPGQRDYSPLSANSPSISQSQHALDDVPTDEECAMFDQEFRNASGSAEPTVPNHNIYSFSQQPLEGHNHQDPVYPPYQLPTNVYTPPKAIERRRKVKRHTITAANTVDEARLPAGNEAGQPTIDFNFDCEIFDPLSRHRKKLANSLGEDQDSDMPIDPELHSMSTLPPAVDLSALDEGSLDTRQSQARKSNPDGSSRPKKRRRIEGPQSTYVEQDSNDGRHTLHEDQENVQDLVLPGIEDPQRYTSLELGTPFIEGIARGGLEYLDSASKVTKSPQQKRKWGHSTSATPAQSENSQEKGSRRSLKEISDKGGTFSPAEVSKIDTFRDKYCEANNMSQSHFNSLIQSSIRGNSQVTAVFNELHEVLPYRPRMSLQKFVRRRFHNYSARGTWTVEEDEMLKRAVVEKGKSWKAVGEMIDRMPGDCRDRWRNYLVNSEHRNREQWTDAEINNLVAAIIECMQLMKNERRQAGEEYGVGTIGVQEDSDQGAEDLKLINWQAVSDRMGKHGGARSRLQCSLKWAQMKRKEKNRIFEVIREAEGVEIKKRGPAKNPWRYTQSNKKVANMKRGDIYGLLQAIIGSKAPTEGNIPWKSLGDDDFRATWNSTDKKTIWFEMKKTVDGYESMEYDEIVSRLLTQLLAEGTEDLNERWDPEVHGDISQKKSRKSEKARGKEKEGSSMKSKRVKEPRPGRERRASVKSSEFVHESEDEETHSANEPQGPRSDNIPFGSENANGYDEIHRQPASDTSEQEEGDGTGAAQESDQNSLFDGPDEAIENQPRRNGEISPEMANKVQLLQFA